MLTGQNYPKQAFVESPKAVSLHQYGPIASEALASHHPCSDFINYRLLGFLKCFKTTKLKKVGLKTTANQR